MGTRLKAFYHFKSSRPSVHKRGKQHQIIKWEEPLPTLAAGSSIEERMVAKELTRRGEPWEPQVSMRGGRARAGGMVVDFLLSIRNTVLRVQGDYFHSRPETLAKDDAQALYLKAKKMKVVDIWEHDINTDVKKAVGDALGV